MNSTEFIGYIDNSITEQMFLGPARNEIFLNGLRNIKSDFNYIASTNTSLSALDIIKKMYKERIDNAAIYKDADRVDLWIQEDTESRILKIWIPEEPSKEEVFNFLKSLTDIPKTKSSFKKFQNACSEKFGQTIDSKIIADYIAEI